MAIENGLVSPREPGVLAIDTPAGRIVARYQQNGRKVTEVRLTNVPAFLHSTGIKTWCEGLGEIAVDVAYGGNFYAIVDAQENFADMADFSAGDLVRMSPALRERINSEHEFVHPEKPDIRGLSHILWTGAPTRPEAHARNAVFYGDKAIDRSPCGTGTSARMAQWAAKGKLKPGDDFVHESIIGSLFHGRVEEAVEVAGKPAIIPSVAGWAVETGLNTITIDDEEDPFAHGFVVR
jgi:4-hydroxyproline epimerase